MNEIKLNSLNLKLLLTISSIFIIWGFWFIYRSSFVSEDGIRYFLIFDDGMISFRYALNIVNGFGPVWNNNEYVEGISNPLWTLVMSACIYIFGQALSPLIIQLIGLVLLLLSAFHIYLISVILSIKFKAKESLFTILPTMIFFAYYPISYWSIGGMEVCLLVFLTINVNQLNVTMLIIM